MTLYYPCQKEETCRVIRKKYKFTDYFIRLVIVTNTLEKGYYFSIYSEEILNFIRKILTYGVKAGDRHFETLNYSASQLKNHSIWMVCDNCEINDIREDVIINELGYGFELEEVLLKRYARRGQAFSTTKYIITVPPECIETIDDVIKPYKYINKDTQEEESGIYTFTDGCGNISV
jgi:RNA-dependent RNA polymerase